MSAEFDASSLRRASRVGRVLLVAVWFVAIGYLALVVARFVAYDRTTLLTLLNAQTLWIFLPAYAVASAAWCFRRYALAVLATVAALFHVATVVPSVGSAEAIPDAARTAPQVRVLSANVLHSNPTKARLARELLNADADVVLLQETTRGWLRVLADAGFDDRYPYRELRPREDSRGQAVYSRLPLTDVQVAQPEFSPTISVSVTVGDTSVALIDVHAVGPGEGMKKHRASVAIIEELAQSLAKPRVVAGDLNATPYNRTLHRMEDLGLESAHEVRGRGLTVTWPNGRHPMLPVRLDHVLVDDAIVVLDVRELAGVGSDHKPVVVEFAIM